MVPGAAAIVAPAPRADTRVEPGIAATVVADNLEALAVDDSGAGFVVLLLGDPHGLEGRQRGQDGSTDPDGVLALWGSDDLDLDGGRGQGSDFLLHTIGNTRVHGGTTGQDGVGVQVLADVNIALHDRVVDGLVDTRRFHSQERRLEQSLRAAETLVADGDDLTVGKFVRLLQGGRGGGGGHFLLEVQGDVAQLLLDVTDDFTLGRGGERVATLGQDLHQVVGQIATSQVQTEDGMGQSITFVDRYGVGDTIARVQHNTGGTTGSVQGQHGLDGDVHGRRVEGLKHDLGHLLAVSLRVQRGLGQQDRVLLRSHTQLVVEGVVPDLLHIIPVGDDTVLDRVLQGEDTTLGLGLITDVRVLVAHTDHHTLVTRTANNGREDGTWGVITSETGLAHSGSVVDDKCSRIIITHLGWVLVGLGLFEQLS
uniref:Uncharacterized protein n=1 Tax=Anopheles atroparvus TaxID=41427 RepID=A0AAG5DIC6_ANOAO